MQKFEFHIFQSAIMWSFSVICLLIGLFNSKLKQLSSDNFSFFTREHLYAVG